MLELGRTTCGSIPTSSAVAFCLTCLRFGLACREVESLRALDLSRELESIQEPTRQQLIRERDEMNQRLGLARNAISLAHTRAERLEFELARYKPFIPPFVSKSMDQCR